MYEFREGLGDVGRWGKKTFGVEDVNGFLRRMVVKGIETLHLVQGLIFLLKFALQDY